MRHSLIGFLTLVLCSSPLAARAQETAARGTIAVSDVVTRMIDNEKALIDRMRDYHPLIEVYVQHVVPDAQLGWTPTADDYFLGQFGLDDDRPRFKALNQPVKTKAKNDKAVQ